MRVMLLLMTPLFLTVSMTHGQLSYCSQMISENRIDNDPVRQDGIVWNATLVLPIQTFTSGWQMTLRFSRSLDLFTNQLAGASSADNRQYVLRAPDDTLPAGSNLTLRFIAYFSDPGSTVTLESVHFDGRLICNGTDYKIPQELLVSVFGTPPSIANSEPIILEPTLRYDYKVVLEKSLLFYEAQRSGLLPIDNRIPWRNDSCFNDRGNSGEDLSGGYYTNGRTLKFTFPLAAAVTMLAWGLIKHEDGYSEADQLILAWDALEWGASYLVRCHTHINELYVLVGDVQREINDFWGRPEDINFHRPAYAINRTSPGSEVAAESAAALAASSVAIRNSYHGGANLSELYKTHAKQLYEFALNNRGDYSKAVPQVADFYKSWSGDEDELVWAALWLFRATEEERYKIEAQDMYRRFNLKQRPTRDFSWDDKTIGVRILLSQMTLESEHEEDSRAFCDNVATNLNLKTPKGLFHTGHEVGAIRYASNVAYLCFEFGEQLRESAGATTNPYLAFAIRQVNYILGETGRSFMIGFGENYPRKPYHSASSCPSIPERCGWEQHVTSENNPHILQGALVGGPDRDDKYEDARNNYRQNDVGVDYNAAFQSLIAGLLSLHRQGLLLHMAYTTVL